MAICRRGLETSVFTAKCSHTFHFSYIIAHIKRHTNLARPIYYVSWRHASFLSTLYHREDDALANIVATVATIPVTTKVYNDDKPLLLMSKPNQRESVQFNPIPKAANEDKDNKAYGDNEEIEDEYRADGILASVMSQAAMLSKERRHQSYIVALKVKVPPIRSLTPLYTSIDLVTMLDKSEKARSITLPNDGKS
ncbi:unnamed protein product, partial [Musa acuminata var. zebrina]